MADYRYSISLRVRHPSRSLEGLAHMLKITPTNTWKAGSPRTTLQGAPLKGVHEENFWMARLVKDDSDTCDLTTALAGILDTFLSKRHILVDIAETGGRSEFFIGWFLETGTGGGDVLGHNLLRRLAEYRIDLSFDIYSNDRSAEPADT